MINSATLPKSGLKRSLAIQGRVIGALLMREVLTRYGRHNIGFLWLFIEPMVFTLGVTTFWMLTRSVHGSDLPIVAFAVTGYSSVLMWRNMPARCMNAIEPNLSLMHHRNVKVIDIFGARLLLEAAGVTTSFVALTLVFTALGWMTLPENVLLVAAGWLLLTWFGASLGMILGSLGARSEVAEKIWHPLSYLLFPLSGAAFLVDWFPPHVQSMILWLPMVNATELIRDGFFGSVIQAHYDVSYVIVFCMGATLVALALQRDTARKVGAP